MKMGLAKVLLRVFIDTTVVLAVIFFMPGLPPHDDLQASHPAPPREFMGALDPKDFALNKVEKLFEEELVGPECLEPSPIDPDVFYTTLKGGAIVKIYDNGSKMQPVAKFGNKCEGLWDARNCGRPLGIRFDKNGHLIAADSYLGLYEVDFDSGKTTQLVSKDDVIEGKTAKTFNSVAPAKDGKIYYTVSSTNYALDDAIGEMFSAPSGRLLVYDPATKKNKVLKENIHFANGIVLSPDEDYLIFVECLQYRLHKYYLKGPKAGTTEVFLDGLPGTPDNLSFSPDGNIFVALVSVRHPGRFNPTEFMYSHPWLRRLLLKTLHLIKLPLDLATKYLDYPISRMMASHVMSFESILPLMPPGCIIIEVDWDGKILNSWHSNDPNLRFFSEAKVINGYMYLASPYNNYLGRLSMPDSVHFAKQPVLTLG